MKNFHTVCNRKTGLQQFLSYTCSGVIPPESDLAARRLSAEALGSAFHPAAVLLPFEYDPEGSRIWLTTRSALLRRHAGQVSFPGGKKEPEDDSAEATAMREAQEEIGAVADDWMVFGTMPECYIPGGYVITPVPALTLHKPLWYPDAGEVAGVFSVPLDIVLDISLYRHETVQRGGRDFGICRLPFGHHDIWGATAAILYHLALLYEQWPDKHGCV